MSQKFRNRFKPSVVVELLGTGELRIAEVKQPVAIYKRGSKTYVRTSAEFADKFEPVTEDKPPRHD